MKDQAAQFKSSSLHMPKLSKLNPLPTKSDFGHQLHSAVSDAAVGLAIFIVASVFAIGAVYAIGSALLEAAIRNTY